MPTPLPSMLQVARTSLTASFGAGAWLMFLEIPTKTLGVVRVVDDTRAWKAHGGKKWQACSVGISDFRDQSTEGALAQMSVVLPNVARVGSAFLEQGELQGQTLTAWFQLEQWVKRSGGMELFVDALSERQLILSASVREKTITLTCGHPAGRARVPKRVFDKSVAPIFASKTTGGGV